jgi:Ni,Fe-hydrogenase III large subunit
MSGGAGFAGSGAGRSRLEVRPGGIGEQRLAPAELEPAAHALSARGARLADLFASVEDGQLVLRIVYALDGDNAYLVLVSPIHDGEYAPLSDIAPAAFVEECIVYEKYGARPSGGKPLNRMILPPHTQAEYPVAGARRVEPREAHAHHYVQGEAFEFPFGPVRVAGWESLYMGLVTTGEEVLDLYLFFWHKHRGVERRLEGLEPERALFFVERAEGLSAVGNGLAYCRALEAIAGVDAPPEAACARAVALELERVYNHAAAIAVLCQTTGLSVGQAQAEIALEQLLRLNLAAFGHRYLFGVVAPGGVYRAPDADPLQRLLGPAIDDLRRVVDALLKTNSHVDRLEATGHVPEETAQRLALVGPVARASGCDLDTRRDHPWAPYGALALQVPVRTGGDVLARMEVFVAEVEESVRLIRELTSEAGAARTRLENGSGSALGWAESPRGESLAWLSLDRTGRIARARLRPGSARNWRAFDDAVRARNVFTDVPIIEASFWLTVAGFSR